MRQVQNWFAQHVTLDDKPYTLDFDQARAVADNHKNTLVTARAGSGKTRVIVAKVAYLVGAGFASLDQIAIFMFNRTAAAEVNQRLANVCIDRQTLLELSRVDSINIASTFHKFALNIVKQAGERPQIIGETEQQGLVRQALDATLSRRRSKLSPKAYQELLSIVSGFITRAGQNYPGASGLVQLQQIVAEYCQAHQQPPEYQTKVRYHKLACQAYREYLQALKPPKTDFNLLMSRATTILQTSLSQPSAYQNIRNLKYLMIDEYQDFSYLFFALTQAIRQLTPEAHLFAVGDDWQAINRFAGSNVDYFINFTHYFPEDYINIPLATNYRSCRRIVEHANHYMLSRYDPEATPAIAKNRQPGKIRYCNPAHTKFDSSDAAEDGLADGRYLMVLQDLLKVSNRVSPSHNLESTARLLKTLAKIVKKHPFAEIMFLHRHNFTSNAGVTLDLLATALHDILNQEGIMDSATFDRQTRFLTMHRSKGLEAEVVVLLEVNAEIVNGSHPHATIFELFGDNLQNERADQQRLLYVALTRAKKYLYILSEDRQPPV